LNRKLRSSNQHKRSNIGFVIVKNRMSAGIWWRIAMSVPPIRDCAAVRSGKLTNWLHPDPKGAITGATQASLQRLD